MGLVQRRLHLRRQRHPFQLQESAAADADQAAVDADRYSVADLVLGRVGWRKIEPFLLRLLQDGQRDRMMEPALGGGGETQDLLRRVPIGGDHEPDFRPFAGQRAGLVEQHGVHLAEQIQGAAVLDQHAALRAQRQCGQHGQRGSHADAGAHVAVEHGGGALRPDHAEGERADPERRDHRLVGEPLALMLRGEFVACGVVENLRDLGGRGFSAGFLDGDDASCRPP